MNSSEEKQPKNRKRAKTDDLFQKLTQHMDAVGKVLCEPTEANTNDRFLKYLGELLTSVPQAKLRKCEQDILQLVNSYADGKDIQLVELHNFD